MKISSEYAKTFGTLQNKLKREYPKTKLKDPDTLPEGITDTLILGILAMDEKYEKALEALERIREDMVDFNELRVTPVSEIVELIEPYLSDPDRAAKEIVKTLNGIFSRFDTLDLSGMKEMTKSDLGKLFEELPGCCDHGRAFMLLFSFEVAEMPLDNQMLDYLVGAGALPPEVDLPAAKSFLERHLKAAETAPLYWQLRKASEEGAGKRKTKSKK
jgi:endonuclease III